MATGAPNAILAINSLDRYITNTRSNLFRCQLSNGSATVLYDPYGAKPIVGSILTIEPEFNTPLAPPPAPPQYLGWPPGVITIISVSPGQFIMSSPATAANAQIVITATFSSTQNNQPLQDALYSSFKNDPPPCNNFTIQSPGALIYGYIQRIVVSQIQVQYNIPTVVFGRNDAFTLIVPPGPNDFYDVNIPFGYYTPEELAAVLQIQIRNLTPATDMIVTFNPARGFNFNSAAHPFTFLDPEFLDEEDAPPAYKAYRLLGITRKETGFTTANEIETSEYPNFLYTPYIDILSDVLTNYQTVKDTNTSTFKPKGLIARVYLSGTGNLQPTEYAPNVSGSSKALGSTPFTVTADLNSPKIIRWNPDVAVPSVDFQLRDCYGDLIPTTEDGYNTEFQMTLLCVEGREWNS
jgi:hypothetical protein